MNPFTLGLIVGFCIGGVGGWVCGWIVGAAQMLHDVRQRRASDDAHDPLNESLQ